MSDLQYCPHCNSYHPASTSMTGCMRAPMAVTSGRHIVPPSLFLDQIEYVTRAEADAMVAAERDRVLDAIYTWVMGSDWQKTTGPYSHKNNQCKHGSFGYEGCEACMEEGLTNLVAAIRKGETP